VNWFEVNGKEKLISGDLRTQAWRKNGDVDRIDFSLLAAS
jgi:hypothetical protein